MFVCQVEGLALICLTVDCHIPDRRAVGTLFHLIDSLKVVRRCLSIRSLVPVVIWRAFVGQIEGSTLVWFAVDCYFPDRYSIGILFPLIDSLEDVHR
jgi:hypothetical protein